MTTRNNFNFIEDKLGKDVAYYISRQFGQDLDCSIVTLVIKNKDGRITKLTTKNTYFGDIIEFPTTAQLTDFDKAAIVASIQIQLEWAKFQSDKAKIGKFYTIGDKDVDNIFADDAVERYGNLYDNDEYKTYLHNKRKGIAYFQIEIIYGKWVSDKIRTIAKTFGDATAKRQLFLTINEYKRNVT